MQQWCASPVVLGEGEQSSQNKATDFLAMGEVLKALREASTQKDVAWITYLCKQGHSGQLLFIETSTRACLSVKADELLRAIEVANKFMDSASGMADLLKSSDDNDISLDSQQVREFTLRFLQVISVDADQLIKAGFDQASEMQQVFKSFMNRLLCKLVDACKKIKNEIGGIFATYESVCDLVTKWDADGIATFSKMEKDEDIKKLSQGVDGV